MLKNLGFSYRVKIPYQQFLTFLSFINIFRINRLQIFFKIFPLKNFSLFWIEKSLQHRCFPVNIAKFLRTTFLRNFSCGIFCIILKVIKQLFCKAIFKEMSLLWGPKFFFFSTGLRETYRLMQKNSNLFFYKFVANFQIF